MKPAYHAESGVLETHSFMTAHSLAGKTGAPVRFTLHGRCAAGHAIGIVRADYAVVNPCRHPVASVGFEPTLPSP